MQLEDGVTTLDSLALTLPDAAAHVRGRLAPAESPAVAASLALTASGYTLVAGLDYTLADSVLRVTPIA